ncbi:beta-galactosidase [Longilinea arvoryzae]|uniref:Beta-galactosidase n=1 Tax=Longilinea arvoryzae TaxID=360412 RepID=A0A0S7BI00_9CHLR|nr:beta-galactosidase [Longilinea arvoryzae]GAP13489.1 beta-galactosidase [Longilinea arvoryzae]
MGAETAPLLSAEIQFWRLDPADWEPCLLALKDIGFEIVATYFSWRRFEPAPGQFDFDGRTDPRLNVRRFLDLCQKHHVRVHLKPGPWICAEEKNGGYPDWLIEHRELLALDSKGKIIQGYNPPFRAPIPSYAHPLYRSYARKWLEAVRAALEGYFYPHGPIILVQLDNEPSMTFHDRLFEGDYNPSIVAENGLYPRWLESRYPGRTPISSAPRSFDHASTQDLFDWTEYKEFLLQDHIQFLKQAFQGQRPLDVLYTLNINEHPQLATPNNWMLLQKACDFIGYDYYFIPPFKWQDCVNMAFAISYSQAVAPLVWAPELMAGIWISPGVDEDHPGFGLSDLAFFQYSAFALGLKGANFYMAVNRENWADAPVTVAGRPGSTYSSVKNLIQLLKRIPDYFSLQKNSQVGVVFAHRDARQDYIQSARSADSPETQTMNGYQRFRAAFDALFTANFNPAIIDFDLPPIDLDQFEAIYYTPKEDIQPQVLAQLLDYAARGGTLCIFAADPGPFLAAAGKFQALSNAESQRYGEGRIVLDPSNTGQTSAENIRDRLAQWSIRPEISPTAGGVITTIHENASGRVCFVLNANAAALDCEFEIRDAGIHQWVSLMGDQRSVPVVQNRLTLALPARSVQAFRLQ